MLPSVTFTSNFGQNATLARTGTDPIDGFVELASRVREDFPNSIYFTSQLVFERDNFLIRLLHNQAALVLPQRLHLAGMQMVILPMKVET